MPPRKVRSSTIVSPDLAFPASTSAQPLHRRLAWRTARTPTGGLALTGRGRPKRRGCAPRVRHGRPLFSTELPTGSVELDAAIVENNDFRAICGLS